MWHKELLCPLVGLPTASPTNGAARAFDSMKEICISVQAVAQLRHHMSVRHSDCMMNHLQQVQVPLSERCVITCADAGH